MRRVGAPRGKLVRRLLIANGVVWAAALLSGISVWSTASAVTEETQALARRQQSVARDFDDSTARLTRTHHFAVTFLDADASARRDLVALLWADGGYAALSATNSDGGAARVKLVRDDTIRLCRSGSPLPPEAYESVPVDEAVARGKRLLRRMVEAADGGPALTEREMAASQYAHLIGIKDKPLHMGVFDIVCGSAIKE